MLEEFVSFFRKDLEKFSIASLVHQWILCSEIFSLKLFWAVEFELRARYEFLKKCIPVQVAEQRRQHRELRGTVSGKTTINRKTVRIQKIQKKVIQIFGQTASGAFPKSNYGRFGKHSQLCFQSRTKHLMYRNGSVH